jgi:hypothetical protein
MPEESGTVGQDLNFLVRRDALRADYCARCHGGSGRLSIAALVRTVGGDRAFASRAHCSARYRARGSLETVSVIYARSKSMWQGKTNTNRARDR